MSVTLKEVAELANVSVATASTALNRGEVKESTRTRVLECAKRLNYVPNRIGRTRGRGLVVPDDVAVVGYDNTDLCLALDPTLTTVDYRAVEVGRCMATQLLALVSGKVKTVSEVIRPFLVEGNRT